MTKYKLAPIEPSDEMFTDVDYVVLAKKSYELMLTPCETVEVVDVEELGKVEPHCEPNNMCDDTYSIAWNDCLNHLTTNGYKIVKVCDGIK